MAHSHYMRFTTAIGHSLDRIGGLPTHLPPEFPRCPFSGEPMSFVAQFHVVEPRLSVRDARLIQIYQCLDDEPWPIAITLGRDAPENTEDLGVIQPLLDPAAIEWNLVNEPVEPGDWDAVETLPLEEEGRLQSSKAGGFCYYDSAIDAGEQFLLQLCEPDPLRRVFGGQTLVLLLNRDGKPEARLG